MGSPTYRVEMARGEGTKTRVHLFFFKGKAWQIQCLHKRGLGMKKLNKTEKHLLLIIRKIQGKNDFCRLKNSWLASQLNCTERTVQRTKRKLLEVGLIFQKEMLGRTSLISLLPINSRSANIVVLIFCKPKFTPAKILETLEAEIYTSRMSEDALLALDQLKERWEKKRDTLVQAGVFDLGLQKIKTTIKELKNES